MITRITLDNFMSHSHTVIEPAVGLTVITGSNNCGKSAVVEALRAVCENTPTDFMVRHGTKEAVVTIETDDGHTIIWRRRKTYASYTIDGDRNDRPTDDYLQRVHQVLRLAPVRASEGKDDFHVHFGTQKSPIFLLNESKLKQATFFASSSDADKLLAMQRRHRTAVADDKRNHQRLSADIAKIDTQLATLQPMPQLVDDAQWLSVEVDACNQLLAAIDRAASAAGALRRWTSDCLAQSERSRELQRLRQPPNIYDELPLSSVIRRIADTHQRLSQASTRGAALRLLEAPKTPTSCEPIRIAISQWRAKIVAHRRASAFVQSMRSVTPPPPMKPVILLESLLVCLNQMTVNFRRTRSAVTATFELNPPPSIASETPLAQLIDRVKTAASAVSRSQSDAGIAAENLAIAKADIVAWASDNPKCPLCNGVVQADQLLAIGGHAHD